MTAVAGVLAAGAAAAQTTLTEDDYLPPDLPVVLTATRLQQSLHDVPGAMTVLDRDTIRRSGVRDVAELLRLVPGYMVGGMNGAHPVAAYHAPLDEYGMRNLVLIDGRPVYSSFFLGDTHRGMMSVLPEDIERIEVLRGANSAAYGANAVFGVINIITRHSADVRDAEAQVSVGSADLRDARIGLSWGEADRAHRLSLAQREDSGYHNAFDDRRLRVLDWRADLRPAAHQDLMLRAGTSDLRSGRGAANLANEPERTTDWREWFLQGRWQRQLNDGGQIQLSADFTDEDYDDLSYHQKYSLVALDYSSLSQRSNLELQHTVRLNDDLRAVWGLGWKQEKARSKPLFYTDQAVSFDEQRLFGHLEWRPTPRWTSNAGLFVGDHSHSGTYLAPRLMFNHHFTPDHTLRFGVNRSFRSNTLLEFKGDIRFDLSPYGGPVQPYWTGNPAIRPEQLDSREISYFGNIRPLQLTFDMRAFHERMHGGISYFEVGQNRIFDNRLDFTVRGVEYQLSWKPGPGSRLNWQQAFTQLDWDDPSRNAQAYNQPPARASTLAWWQQLPQGFDLTLIWHERSPMTWGKGSRDRLLPAASRVDLRLARPWRFHGSKAEWALTVQALNGGYAENDVDNIFQRRTFLTFKVEH
jgi:iron complex outermembrane receptor protein